MASTTRPTVLMRYLTIHPVPRTPLPEQQHLLATKPVAITQPPAIKRWSAIRLATTILRTVMRPSVPTHLVQTTSLWALMQAAASPRAATIERSAVYALLDRP